MASFLIDTNICIYVMNGAPVDLGRRFDRSAGLLAISSVTLAELEFGIAHSKRKAMNRRALDAILTRLEVMDFDSVAARHFGEIRAMLYRQGKPIGPLDTLIAAHARSLKLTLVTNNRSEFDRVPGLKVESWL